MDDPAGYRFEPVTAQRGADLEAFARAHGKFGYCSCMRWRLPSGPYRDLGRNGRAAALAGLVQAGEPAGVLAYQDEQAVGWCSIAPRDSYRAISTSRVIPRLPGDGVWSVACFFLAPQARRRGLTKPLLQAACCHAARSCAARCIKNLGDRLRVCDAGGGGAPADELAGRADPGRAVGADRVTAGRR